MSHDGSYRVYFRCLFLFVLFVASSGASFHGFYSKWHFLEPGTAWYLPKDTFTAMVDGTADRPYVYRRLLPAVANWMDGHVSERAKDVLFAIKGPFGKPILTFFFDSPLALNRTYFLRYTIIYVMVSISAFISVWAMYLALRVVGQSSVTSALAAVTMILLMPYFLTGGGYFYDYPELAFLALAFLMSFRFAWWWMLPLVVLATWNKESFLLFIPTLYPILRVRSSRLSALIGTTVLCLTCVAVYLVIRVHFRGNPGSPMEFHLLKQIESMFSLSNWFEYDVTYGLLAIRGINLVSAGFVIGACRYGWGKLPDAVKRHARLAAAINIPFYLLFGYPQEIRTLSLLYPTLLVLIAVNLTDWIGEQSGEAKGETIALPGVQV